MRRFQDPQLQPGLSEKPVGFLKIVFAHKIGLLVLVGIVVCVAGGIGARAAFTKLSSAHSKVLSFNNIPLLPLESSSPQPSLSPSPTPSPSDDTVLGTTTDTVSYTPPAPLPTDTPLPTPLLTPTPTPAPVVVTSSSSSCSGTPNADNSQVYVSPSSAVTGASSTITVELLDCNNSYASNDKLSITLVSGNSSTTVNGTAIGSSYQAQAQNGQYSFQVSSSTAATDVFKIMDTSQNFEVTTPGYHEPQVAFGSNTTGNSNCTTGAGVPNSWYSDVYPPSSTSVGSTATFSVVIRDCYQNPAPVSDTLEISLKSGDSGTQVNNQTPPISISTQNGQASFGVTAQTATTATFVVNDTTRSFDVTTSSNQNPSVTFTSVTATPTPTPSPSATPTPTPTVTPTPTASASASPS